jgi:hypothetical protein
MRLAKGLIGAGLLYFLIGSAGVEHVAKVEAAGCLVCQGASACTSSSSSQNCCCNVSCTPSACACSAFCQRCPSGGGSCPSGVCNVGNCQNAAPDGLTRVASLGLSDVAAVPRGDGFQLTPEAYAVLRARSDLLAVLLKSLTTDCVTKEPTTLVGPFANAPFEGQNDANRGRTPFKHKGTISVRDRVAILDVQLWPAKDANPRTRKYIHAEILEDGTLRSYSEETR